MALGLESLDQVERHAAREGAIADKNFPRRSRLDKRKLQHKDWTLQGQSCVNEASITSSSQQYTTCFTKPKQYLKVQLLQHRHVGQMAHVCDLVVRQVQVRHALQRVHALGIL